MDKLGKREAKKQLKNLCNVPGGVTPSMQYEQLKRAKEFAKAQGLDFPVESQAQLTRVALATLGLALDFSLSNGVFK